MIADITVFDPTTVTNFSRLWNSNRAADHQSPANRVKHRKGVKHPRPDAVRTKGDEMVNTTLPKGNVENDHNEIEAEAKPIIKSDSIFWAFVRIVFMVGLIVNPLQTSNLVNDHHEFSR